MVDELDDFQGPVSLPGEPTDAIPGSDQKIRIMMERATRREELFHPQDGHKRPTRTLRTPGKHLLTWAIQSPDEISATASVAAPNPLAVVEQELEAVGAQ